MRLIDADALMEYCLNQKIKTVDCNDIARFPTIEERKTGHWILHPEQEKNIFGVKQIECSECGDKCFVQFVEKEKYCRNCGAKMEEAGSEDIPMEYFESGGR